MRRINGRMWDDTDCALQKGRQDGRKEGRKHMQLKVLILYTFKKEKKTHGHLLSQLFVEAAINFFWDHLLTTTYLHTVFIFLRFPIHMERTHKNLHEQTSFMPKPTTNTSFDNII